MSDAGRENREWRLYVDDMIGFAGKVLAYTDGLDQAAFVADGLTYDATLRNLALIGESANRIPAVKAANSEIPRPDHRDAQSPDPRLSRHRRRHHLEHRPGRCAGLAGGIAAPAAVTGPHSHYIAAASRIQTSA